MAKKVFIAREIQVPEGLATALDKRANHPEGTVDGLIADEGWVRQRDNALLAVALTPDARGILEDKSLPGGPAMTIERFSNLMWAISIAYCTGTIEASVEKAKARLGAPEDIGFLAGLIESDEILLRNGGRVSRREFMAVLKDMTSEKALERVWEDVAPSGFKGLIRNTKLKPSTIFKLVFTVFEACDDMMDEYKK